MVRSLLTRRRFAGGGAVLLAVLAVPSLHAQAVRSYPGDSITARPPSAQRVYVPGPIAPTLPGDTLLGGRLSSNAAVPRHHIAPTMPGDVITRQPQWARDSARADSIREGILPADTLRPEGPGVQILPDWRERADSLRVAPQQAPARPAAPAPRSGVRRS